MLNGIMPTKIPLLKDHLKFHKTSLILVCINLVPPKYLRISFKYKIMEVVAIASLQSDLIKTIIRLRFSQLKAWSSETILTLLQELLILNLETPSKESWDLLIQMMIYSQKMVSIVFGLEERKPLEISIRFIIQAQLVFIHFTCPKHQMIHGSEYITTLQTPKTGGSRTTQRMVLSISPLLQLVDLVIFGL